LFTYFKCLGWQMPIFISKPGFKALDFGNLEITLYKVDKKNLKSSCCDMPVDIGGDRSTHYYICSKCRQPCDTK